MNKNNETKLTFDNEGLHIASEDVTEKLAKKNISPSMITGIKTCPAKWLAETFVIPDVVDQELDNPATRGTLYHSVMEEFFKEPNEDRTQAMIKTKIKEALKKPDFQHFAVNKDAIQWLRDAINGYYSMGADPKKVNIASVDTPHGPKPGLELFVKGKIGDTQRNVLGFIDRVIYDSRDESKLVIEDWKTGAKAKHWDGKFKNSKKPPEQEGIPEQRQQMIYTMLMENQGYDISTARLIYPVPREIVKVQTKSVDLREKVIKDVEDTDAG